MSGPEGSVVELHPCTTLEAGSLVGFELSATQGWRAILLDADGLPSDGGCQQEVSVGDDGCLAPMGVRVTRDAAAHLTHDPYVTLQLRMIDPTRQHDPEDLRYHWRASGDGLIPVDGREVLEARNVGFGGEYAFDEGEISAIIEGPLPGYEGEGAYETYLTQHDEGPIGTALGAMATESEMRSVMGHLSFWDTRDFMSNDAGSRLAECDSTDHTCDPGQTDCCFRAIPYVMISLIRWDGMDAWEVDTKQTDASGFFWLADSAWQPGYTYWLRVHYIRSGWPAAAELNAGSGTGGAYTWFMPYFQLTSTIVTIPNAHVNVAGDTTSQSGDLATIWDSTTRTFRAMSSEGETRYRYTYGSGNTFDPYYYHYFASSADIPNATCNTQVAEIPSWRARATTTAPHETGHLYHGRVVGCYGSVPDFPDRDYHAYGWRGSEGGALTEAIAGFIYQLSMWDPSLASSTSLSPCADNSAYLNSNDCSADRNNSRGLWEFIDTDTGNADQYADGVDISLKDIMDGLVSWQQSPCVQGQNRSSCEMYWVLDDPPVSCDLTYGSEDCPHGHVCDGTTCWGGDPHGNNLRDWVHYIALVMQASETVYWQTMVSSPCIGSSDNSYPFNGGYHYD